MVGKRDSPKGRVSYSFWTFSEPYMLLFLYSSQLFFAAEVWHHACEKADVSNPDSP